MATNLTYTLQDLQDRINTLVNNDSDTPESTDDEWTTVLNIINQAIGKWESKDVFWDELWTSYTHGSVIADGTSTYSLSSLTDMKKPGGYLELTLDGVTSKVELISPEQAQTYPSSARVAYITGNNLSGLTLNLGWTPATGDGTVGATMSLAYYKYATRFDSNSSLTAVAEMSDPNYIVYDVAATKSLLESKNNQFSVFSTEANACLENMMILNEISSPYQNGDIEDLDFINNGASIGE